MKILKIKKGFITNSSGSYEWLPTNTPSVSPIVPNQPALQPNNQPSPTTPPSNNITQKPYVAPSSSGNNEQKNGLDPNAMLLAAVVIIIAVVAMCAEIAKIFLMRIEKNKKNRKRNDHN